MSQIGKVCALAACTMLWAPRVGLAGDWVSVKVDASFRQYCHEIRFPMGWQRPDEFRGQPVIYDFQRGYYEFRFLGSPGSKFLVRGFVPVFGERSYTPNLYSVDLSDPAGVAQPAREEDWNSAHPVQPESKEFEKLGNYLKSLGFPLKASGDHEEGWSLSPDRAVFIRFSWKGTLGCCGGSDVPGDLRPHFAIGRNPHGKLFFDAYSTTSGKKLVTVSANFSIIFPEAEFSRTGWVTGRYFYMPLDDRKIRCLVCEFGNRR